MLLVDLADPPPIPAAGVPGVVVAVGESVRGSFFQPASTPTQLEILERLEVLLALVEGWVDHVVAKATAPWMSHAAQLGEVLNRRRASASRSEAIVRCFSGRAAEQIAAVGRCQAEMAIGVRRRHPSARSAH